MSNKDAAFIVDLSHWEPDADAAQLSGLDCLISRMGTQLNNINPAGWMDNTFPPNCQVAADIINPDGTQGIPLGGYWYDDWTWFLDMQWNLEKVRNLTPDTDPRIVATRRALFAGTAMRRVHFLVIDVEQPPHQGMSQSDNWANWISTSARSYVDNLLYMMSHGEIPQMPIMMYARQSYIQQWCIAPGGDCPLTDWMAAYQTNLGPGRFYGWVAHWIGGTANPAVVYNPITAKATIPADTIHPITFSSWPNIIWQYQGDLPSAHQTHMAGITDERNIPLVVDCNITRITKEDFYEILHFSAGPTPPEPEPEPIQTQPKTVITVVAEGITNLRNEPTTAQGDKTVIGKVVKGMQFYDLIGMHQSGADVWYNLDVGVWIAGIVNNKIYTQLSTIEVVV